MREEEIWTKSGYVAGSTYRYKVLNCIINLRFATPTKIANNCGIRVNHISKVLRELKEQELIRCVNEEAHKGRVYTPTNLGEQIFKEATTLVEM